MHYALCVVNHRLPCVAYWLNSLIAQVIQFEAVYCPRRENRYCLVVVQREEVLSEATFVSMIRR